MLLLLLLANALGMNDNLLLLFTIFSWFLNCFCYHWKLIYSLFGLKRLKLFLVAQCLWQQNASVVFYASAEIFFSLFLLFECGYFFFSLYIYMPGRLEFLSIYVKKNIFKRYIGRITCWIQLYFRETAKNVNSVDFFLWINFGENFGELYTLWIIYIFVCRWKENQTLLIDR